MKRTPLKRTKRLVSVSKRRQKLNKEYSKLRKEFLEAHPYCQWWLAEKGFSEHEAVLISHGPFKEKLPPASEDIHHVKGRGRYLLDTSTWMAVSRMAHITIHLHPKQSREKGYLV